MEKEAVAVLLPQSKANSKPTLAETQKVTQKRVFQ